MRFPPQLTAAGLGLLVSACLTSSGTVYHIDDPYQFLSYAGSRGSIPVEITGDPVAGQRPQIEAAALHSLRSQFPTQAAMFQPAAAAAGEGTKIVLLFNGGYSNADDVCRDPTRFAGVAAQTSITRAGVVYCGVGPYSEAWVNSDKPIQPGTEEFQALMNQLIADGVPRRRIPQRENGDQPPP